jgi:predicted DNA binding CopG/RHH family protein
MSKKKRNVFDVPLDSYEQEIEKALPNSLNKLSIKNLNEELAFSKEAAANYLRKDTKINIRLSHHDIDGLRRLAVREGLPYQTLIASILHKYVSHHLQTNEGL